MFVRIVFHQKSWEFGYLQNAQIDDVLPVMLNARPDFRSMSQTAIAYGRGRSKCSLPVLQVSYGSD
jgi:hypothetical protein